MRTSYSDQSVRLWICRTWLISYFLTGLILLKLQPKKKRMCSDCISKVKVTTGLCLKFSSKQYNLSLWPNLTEPSFTDYKVYSDPELSFYDQKIWLLCKIFVSTYILSSWSNLAYTRVKSVCWWRCVVTLKQFSSQKSEGPLVNVFKI